MSTSLVKEIEALRKTFGDEREARKGFEKELMKLTGSVSACDELPARLIESDKTLEISHAEWAILKEQVPCTDK